MTNISYSAFLNKLLPVSCLAYIDVLRQFYRSFKSKINGVSYPRFHHEIDLENDKLIFPSNEKRGKRILFLMCWFETGGAEFFAFERIRHFSSRGDFVYAISTEKKGISKIHEIQDYCEISLSLIDENVLDQETFIIDFIEKNKIDAIYLHHSTLGYKLLISLKEKFKNLKVYDSLHIIEPCDGGFVHLSGIYSPYIDLHHVVSPSLKYYLEKKFNVCKEKIIFYPLSYMSQDLIEPSVSSKENLEYKIVFIGRLVQQKRPYYFLNIAEAINKNKQLSGINFRFDIYGEGPLRQEMEDLIKKKQLDNVHLHGEVLDKGVIFAKAYALVISSENEGLPLTCYESTRSNVLCFSTETGQVKDFLDQYFLVSPFNPLMIANRIIDSIYHQNQTKRLFELQKQRITRFDKIYKSNGDIF